MSSRALESILSTWKDGGSLNGDTTVLWDQEASSSSMPSSMGLKYSSSERTGLPGGSRGRLSFPWCTWTGSESSQMGEQKWKTHMAEEAGVNNTKPAQGHSLFHLMQTPYWVNRDGPQISLTAVVDLNGSEPHQPNLTEFSETNELSLGDLLPDNVP